jgi:hypothetical protein
MQFNDIEVSLSEGFPIYAVKADEFHDFDRSQPRLKINNTQCVILTGNTLGSVLDEGQTRPVLFLGYLRTSPVVGV